MKGEVKRLSGRCAAEVAAAPPKRGKKVEGVEEVERVERVEEVEEVERVEEGVGVEEGEGLKGEGKSEEGKVG